MIPLILFVNLFLVLPGIGIAIIKWGVLPPERLTPLVVGYIDPLVEGEIRCERIELTFIETFPQVGLRITGGEVLSAPQRNSAPEEEHGCYPETLLRFSEAVVSVNIRDYFQHDRITVDRLTLKEPFFYGLIDQSGRAN
ncbi:MAG: hypothetical protein LUD68_10560 [Rikenellaceae bacterium]|nr:hypothetical protein [Rikenellaceae bacterium]